MRCRDRPPARSEPHQRACRTTGATWRSSIASLPVLGVFRTAAATVAGAPFAGIRSVGRGRRQRRFLR